MLENYITTQTEKGNISISEDVLNVIITSTVTEVNGVAGMANTSGSDITEFLGLKSTSRGIKITEEDGKTVVNVLIMVRYGSSVTVVAKKAQEAVCSAIETMTGMKPVVNVHVSGIAFDRTDMKG